LTVFFLCQVFEDPNNLLRKAVDQAMGGHPNDASSGEHVGKVDVARRTDAALVGRRKDTDMFKLADTGQAILLCFVSSALFLLTAIVEFLALWISNCKHADNPNLVYARLTLQ
jgi:hypothetical protein